LQHNSLVQRSSKQRPQRATRSSRISARRNGKRHVHIAVEVKPTADIKLTPVSTSAIKISHLARQPSKRNSRRRLA